MKNKKVQVLEQLVHNLAQSEKLSEDEVSQLNRGLSKIRHAVATRNSKLLLEAISEVAKIIMCAV